MSDVKRTGLKPLRSSTNLINNNDKLFDRRKSLTTPTTDQQQQPKVSVTEHSIDQQSTPINKSRRSFKSIVNELNRSKKDHQKSSSTTKQPLGTSSNSKQIIKRNSQSLEKKKVKIAIKTVISKDQRIKRWLTSKEPVKDVEYWRLTSERLSKELMDTLERADELDLERELLIAEYNEMNKLADNAFKLNRLLEKINDTKLNNKNNNNNDNSIEDGNQTLNSLDLNESTEQQFDDSTHNQ